MVGASRVAQAAVLARTAQVSGGGIGEDLVIVDRRPIGGGALSAILLEDNSRLLMESGDKIMLEA